MMLLTYLFPQQRSYVGACTFLLNRALGLNPAVICVFVCMSVVIFHNY